MIALIDNNRTAITALCKKHRVLELYIFGSATKKKFDAEKSDIDFAVIFDSNIPVLDMADHYFGLIDGLEKLLDRPIDLVSIKAIKNRIFKEELERTMIPLYAA